jgi:hypothetical protein
MFESIIKFFTPKHRHRETIGIIFSTSVYFPFNRRFPLIGSDGITCHLHTCPDCGEVLELGKHAQLLGEKFGNYYALRRSLKLAKEIFKTKEEYKISQLQNKKYSIHFNGNDFYFYKEEDRPFKQKPKYKSIDLAA